MVGLRAQRQHMMLAVGRTKISIEPIMGVFVNVKGMSDYKIGRAHLSTVSSSPPSPSSPHPSLPLPLAAVPPMPRIMHPDWYRTPLEEDDPRMIGDYPVGQVSSYQTRDPYAPYYDRQNRRYFGEPIPEDYEPLIMWSFDVEERFGLGWAVASLGSLLGGCFLLYQLCGREPSVFATQRVPKDLPTVSEYYRGGIIPEYLRRD